MERDTIAIVHRLLENGRRSMATSCSIIGMAMRITRSTAPSNIRTRTTRLITHNVTDLLQHRDSLITSSGFSMLCTTPNYPNSDQILPPQVRQSHSISSRSLNILSSSNTPQRLVTLSSNAFSALGTPGNLHRHAAFSNGELESRQPVSIWTVWR